MNVGIAIALFLRKMWLVTSLPGKPDRSLIFESWGLRLRGLLPPLTSPSTLPILSISTVVSLNSSLRATTLSSSPHWGYNRTGTKY